MPRSGDQPGDWLDFARDDLGVARADHAPRIRCFHAQQVAEKSIKAVLIAFDIDFPWTHSLSVLTKLLPDQATPFPTEDALGLTDYAVDARYPRPGRSISAREVDEAVELAQIVLQWAATIVESRH